MKVLLFFVVSLLFVAAFFVSGFFSKKKVYSRTERKWITKTSNPGKIAFTIILIFEGIGMAVAYVFTGAFMSVLEVSVKYAEADINPIYCLFIELVAVIIYIFAVITLSQMAYLFGQSRKEEMLSSGR